MAIDYLDKDTLDLSENEQKTFQALLTNFEQKARDIVMEEYEDLKAETDAQILAQRGIRQLTSEEKNFYNKLAEVNRSATPQAALSELEVVLPETTIDAIFDDLTGQHPLLSKIQFMNIKALVHIYLSDTPKQLATWDELNTSITKELEGSFKEYDFGQQKLSAWIPVHNDMLTLGPAWLDRYVRVILSEAIAYGLEDAIINGNGNKQPIGMKMDVETEQVTYTEKEAISITHLDPKTYGEILSTLTVTPNKHYRAVSRVLMVVNPVDYMKLVMPATTIQNAQAGYVTNVLPFPTDIVQSEQMEQGKAIIGLPDRYFMGLGAGDAKIYYSDDFKFLEDVRTYKTKVYGTGRPLDNNAFIVADISKLEPTYFNVNVINSGE